MTSNCGQPKRDNFPIPSSSPACFARSGTTGRKARSSGGSGGQTCRSAGRWKPSRGHASPVSARKQIRAFAELDFVAKHENIVLVGQTGVGKTGLACGLLLKALQNGYRCQFVRAQDLFDEMYASLADRSTRRLLNRLVRLDLLLTDEFGYLNLKPEQSNTFFKLMEERYHRHSTIITTNLIYDEWHNFLGNKSMVEALLSRVRHYCHTVTINGPSLRDLQG
jgi:DNA replication protein DnaC